MTALEYWIELYGLPENECQRLGVAMMRMYADQQTKELSKLLPDSFHANTPLEHRIEMMIDIWNRSVKVAQELQKENERLKEAMQEFVSRVDKGEIRSTYTYNKFKELLK